MLPGGVGDRTPPVGAGVVDIGVQPDYDVQLATQRGPDGPAGLRYRSPGPPAVGCRIVDIEIGAAEAARDVELAADDTGRGGPVKVGCGSPSSPLVRRRIVAVEPADGRLFDTRVDVTGQHVELAVDDAGGPFGRALRHAG